MSALLRVSGLEVVYGSVPAVAGVGLEIPAGEIRAILGANGAGKSSTIKAILGLLRPRAGAIEFEGRPIHGLPTHRIHQLGIAWVPEGRQLFSTLTVHENLEMGAFARGGAGLPAKLDEVFALFPRLRERRTQVAGSLSGGEQQMLAIARALMAEPKLLLMDEPSLGLAPKVVQRLFEQIQEINARGLSILMVEQNARQALRIAHYAYLLEVGRLAGEGPPAALAASERVQRVYLGG
ncbi:MAG TPA: ABC transporter ATP-binding protein [Candidatus Methylomirabilis sp.]|nr:ABC transporter ATP-binding protein [Candidatus Methylomirabilis sp.]